MKEKPGNFESEFGQHKSLLDVENETNTVYKGEHEIESCQDFYVSTAMRNFLETMILNNFACPKSHSWTEGSGHENQHHTKVSEPLIDAKDTLTEWKELKPRVIALKFRRDNTRNCGV